MGKRSQNARDEHGRWDPGAGGLKHGQSVEQSMLREIKEEYGTKPISYSFLGYFDSFRQTDDGQPTHWVALCFAALVDADSIKINEPDMIDEIGWFSLDNLPTPMHSQFPNFMNRFGKQIKILLKEE